MDLARPVATASGRYWYNPHVVPVTAGRCRFGGEQPLGRLRGEAFAAGAREGFRVRRPSLMPDRLHLAPGGAIERSPKETGLVFQNRLADVAGCRARESEFRVGTFSEYGAWRVR